ncbi:MAG: DUF4870 domain-containing protein [Steroidobacteraceae bacterium]|nr:DUF4870 domain-containing protein [Steroidobacteraceae bacterium]
MNEVSKDDRNMGLFVHLAALAGFVVPVVGNILGPLVIWILQKDKSAFVADQGAEAINFNITVTIVAAVLAALSVLVVTMVITIPGFVILGIGWLVLTIMAAVKASNGERYRYPFTWRLVK